MHAPVILSALEQEYLLHIAESAVAVRAPHDFFLWAQGQLQALLPHTLMVAMRFDPDGALLHTEAVHACLLAEETLASLCHPEHGLAPRLARQCGASVLALAAGQAGPAGPAALAPLRAELEASGFAHVLLHGTGALAGGGTAFALFGLPAAPDARQAHCMTLLLPHLHLAMGRLAGAPARRAPAAPAARALSGREHDILRWLREGKKNAEIGAILGISALTVKNHLQRIYPLLGARNRTEAVARSHALRPPARR